MSVLKRTKIVATVGPATQSPAMLKRLIQAGVNVFRLNFSHGTHDSHLAVLQSIRRLREELNLPVAILQDLSGPKIRIGKIDPEPLVLKKGDLLIIDPSQQEPSGKNIIGISYGDFAKDVFPGARLLIGDGDLEFRVKQVEEPRVICEVLRGGALFSHKGIDYPSGSFNIPALTPKDREDLKFGLAHDVDFVAMSFVRSGKDLLLAQEIFREVGKKVPLIAKIEKHEALDHLDDIVTTADGIMVARGDLGVEVDIERVPVIQKKLIKMANQAGKPVITATQMLRSMVDSPRPTRAEVTDVANAILDGSDAVMLSEETAVGHYPVEAVEMMTRVALETEMAYPYYLERRRTGSSGKVSMAVSVAHAAAVLATDLQAGALIALTRSGYTAQTISKLRPRSYIMALTADKRVYYRLNLNWGVIPTFYAFQNDMRKLVSDCVAAAANAGLLKSGDRYVITSGFPLGEPGSINQVTAGEYK